MQEPPERAPRTDASLAQTNAPSAAPEKAGAEAKGTDVVFVHGPTPTGVQITRLRGGSVETGELRPMKDGQPITGEIVKLSSREESPRLFDVEVLASAGARPLPAEPDPARERRGPSRVSNERFRANWDVVFGARAATKGDLPS